MPSLSWLLAGLLLCAAERIVVLPNDPSILHLGGGWAKRSYWDSTPSIPAPCTVQDDEGPATSAAGDALSFVFEGVSIDLVMEPRADHGIFSVFLDDEPLSSTNHSAAPSCRVAYASPRLERGRHTLLVKLLGKALQSPWPTAYLHLRSLTYETGKEKRADASATSPGPAASSTQGVDDSPLLLGDKPGTVPRRIIAGIALGVAGGIITLTFSVYFLHRAWRRKHPKQKPIEMEQTSKKAKRVSRFDQEYFMAPAPPLPVKKSRRRRRSSARGAPPGGVHLQLDAPPLPTAGTGDAVSAIKHKPSVVSATSSAPLSVTADGLVHDETIGKAL